MVIPRNDLASAFGFGEQEPEPAPTTDFSNTPQLRDDLMRLRESQQASLEQHQQFAQSRQEMQGQLQARQADIAASQELLRGLDPNLNRAARGFALRGFVRSIGVDPKGEAAKELITLSTQLSGEELQAFRSYVVAETQNAAPGQVRQTFGALFRGNIPAGELLHRVSTHAQERAMQEGQQVAQNFGPASDTTRVPTPSNTERPAIHQEVDPALIAVLPGLEPGQRLRLGELQQLYPHIASDPQGQRDLAKVIREQNASMRTFLDQAEDLQRLIKGDPAALGPLGTGSQYWESFRAQFAAAYGITKEALPDPESSRIRRAADTVANAVLSAHGLERTADNRARINTLVTRMAYSMLQQNEPGGRYTEQDILRAMQQIGQSADPSQFQAALTATVGNQYRAYQQRLSEATGGEMGLPIDRLPSSRIAEIGQNPMMPIELRRQAALIWKQRGMDRQPEMREAVGKPGTEPQTDNVTAPPQNPVEPSPAAAPSQPQPSPRRQSSIEREEAALRAQAAEQQRLIREAQQLQQALAIRSNAIAEEGNQRANRAEQRDIERYATAQREKKQARLEQIFAQIGRTVAGSTPNISVGRSGGGGSEQSSAAFVIPAKPRREPPRIPSVRKKGE